jgi:hypothetical protein
MIDNFELIKPLLSFDSEDDLYYIQVMQRKKENPDIGTNTRTIKEYYFNNLAYLESRYDEIKKLCNFFNARAGLRLNKRSARKVALKTLQNISENLIHEAHISIKSAYSKACGQCHNDKNKKWIVDIDTKNIDHVDKVKSAIYKCEPRNIVLYATIPSVAGMHLITSPFNVQEFKSMGFTEDIHKDNPTNLYIP